MKLGFFPKQPGERESYTITYEDTLHAGDNIVGAVVKSIEPAGQMIVDQVTVIDPRVRFWCDAGVDKTKYKITFIVTSADGRRFEDEVTIQVKEY